MDGELVMEGALAFFVLWTLFDLIRHRLRKRSIHYSYTGSTWSEILYGSGFLFVFSRLILPIWAALASLLVGALFQTLGRMAHPIIGPVLFFFFP